MHNVKKFNQIKTAAYRHISYKPMQLIPSLLPTQGTTKIR